ncbi:MAG: CPBP family intramembrane metalloprotease [Oscillospiraceae bacterium]|nr:CPBP family intramembrane metalloprotease [Oscillospiraceae bacterium]
MEQQLSPTRPHPFFDKHTILGTVVIILWAYCIVMFTAAFPITIICMFLGLGDPTDYLFLGIIVTAPLTLLIHRLWFIPDFKGILFRGFLKTLRCCPVILLFWLALCLPDFLHGDFPQTFNLKVISLSLTAGFSEEVIFRGLPLSYLKRQLRSEKQVPLIVIITGAIFGLTHLTNVFVGASVSASLLQGVTTTCIGIFFGAVFMRGGNILVPMLLHTLHDALLLSFMEADEVSAVLEEEASLNDIPTVLICAALAAFGFFLIRRSKRREICDMWAETWSQTTENLPENPAEPETLQEV